jgi:uncharacterized protein (DUF4415 family)
MHVKEKPMKSRSIDKPLTNTDGDVRELTATDFARMRPAREVLPEIFPAKLAAEMLKPKGRGPGRKPAKAVTTLRLPADTLMRWKATGPGWQTRMAKLLAEAL